MEEESKKKARRQFDPRVSKKTLFNLVRKQVIYL